ncbi:complex I NDUFA9 subunit family protein [Albidovulum sp.]
MSRLVTIYGGSGFLGRYIARRMAKLGWRVRVACRRPNEALFVRTYGAVGQVEPILCNIRDEASVRAAMAGADAVVNCVGTFDSRGRNNFSAVQAEAPGRIARLAREAGIGSLVHISALGADAASESAYARSKAAGEAAVAEHFPGAMILRPSVIFGPEDQLFNRFAAMARFTLVMPAVGAATRFQPVYVDDVARAAVKGVLGEACGIFELGGPDICTMREIIARTLAVTHRRRLIVSMPFWAAGILAALLDFGSMLTGGLVANRILTRDQVRMLRHDNVVTPGARGLADLGIEPTPMEAVLPGYLWRFRPSGQYDEITASARGLRKQS